MGETPQDLANEYVHTYGAKHREVTKDFGMPLRDVLHHHTYVKGQCYDVSHDFKRWGESNYPNHEYRIIHGAAFATPNTHTPEIDEHWAVLVDGEHVVDHTRRQFEPNAPVPSVMSFRNWRQRHPELEESTMNISKMIRQVSNGQDPTAALSGESFEHQIPRLVEGIFGSQSLENLYGDDFDEKGKARTFPTIDTGAGVRIRNITVHPNYRMEGHDAATLPHARNSRIYIQTTEGHRTLDKAFRGASGFFKGDDAAPAPADQLHHENPGGLAAPSEPAPGRRPADDVIANMSPGPIGDMMKLRLPENNPHQAWRDGVLPHVFKHLGMTGTGTDNQPHAQWHRHAGCGTCPCSPGFILHKSNHPMAHNHDIWVEVD